MKQVTMKTGRLYVVSAMILILTGLLLHLFPHDFRPDYYAPLLPHLPLLSLSTMAGGLTLLVCARYGLTRWVRRTLVLFPASVLLALAYVAVQRGGWTGGVAYAGMALGVLCGAWVSRPAGNADSPDLFTLVFGLTQGLIGLLLLGAPALLASRAYWLVRPAAPLFGALALAGAAALLLPEHGRWLRPHSLWRLLLASAIPAWFTVSFLSAGAWTGSHWLIIGLAQLSLAAPDWFSSRRKLRPVDPLDPATAHLDAGLEAWNWGIAAAVVVLTSLKSTALAEQPVRANLFVAGVVIYNLIMHWTIPNRIEPRSRALLHLGFLVAAIGFILPEGGPATHGFIPLLVMIPVVATRVAGIVAGWRMLLLAAASLGVAMLEGLLFHGAQPAAVAELVVEAVVLLTVAVGGLLSTADHVRTVRDLAQTRFRLERQVLQMSLVDQIGHSIHSSLDLDQTLSTAVSELGQALSADRCFLQVGDGDRFLPVVHQYVRAGIAPIDAEQVQACPFLLRAVQSQRLVAVADTRTAALPAAAEVAAAVHAEVAPLAVASCLAVPLLSESGLVGAVAFHQCDVPREWTAEEIEFVERVARQLSVALTHARTHRELTSRHADLVRQEAVLREREELFHTAFQNAPIGMALIDPAGRFLQVNAALAEMLGYAESELLTMTPEQFTHPEDLRSPRGALSGGETDRVQWEKRYIHKDGRIVWAWVSLSLVQDAGTAPLYYVGHVQDVTERKRTEEQLIHMANFDPLTDLFNRRRFHEELERALADSERYGTEGALLFLDLDQFKYLNDSLGHLAGDRLLRSLANLLRNRLRRTDVIARLGGDEFAILLAHVDEQSVRRIAETLVRAIREHRELLAGQAVDMTASVGVALFPAHGTTAEELLSRADLAMYQAKEDGRNRYALFSREVERVSRIGSRLAWERRIRHALEHDRFVLHAQPILNIASGQIRQYELLLRMVGDDGETVLPGEFLDVAERFGLIHEIDRWVVRQAIHLLAAWNLQGPPIALEVNISGKAFNDPELLPLIRRELALTGADPANLVLEITETAAIADTHLARQFVETLREIGCRFALDDFGSGFSSFFYLKHLPVDYLKIDGSFIRNLPLDDLDQKLVSTVVTLARGLGKQTIAEFVSDEATVQKLQELGVDLAQGYHVGKPGIFSELKAGTAEKP